MIKQAMKTNIFQEIRSLKAFGWVWKVKGFLGSFPLASVEGDSMDLNSSSGLRVTAPKEEEGEINGG